mmetsp:Transcript_59742/g.163755  ORF Transcript_59742/g.163755 Transcript_59742/m.163755 type:complete len:215 (-) Transcript_59742:285-929(-)
MTDTHTRSRISKTRTIPGDAHEMRVFPRARRRHAPGARAVADRLQHLPVDRVLLPADVGARLVRVLVQLDSALLLHTVLLGVDLGEREEPRRRHSGAWAHHLPHLAAVVVVHPLDRLLDEAADTLGDAADEPQQREVRRRVHVLLEVLRALLLVLVQQRSARRLHAAALDQLPLQVDVRVGLAVQLVERRHVERRDICLVVALEAAPQEVDVLV